MFFTNKLPLTLNRTPRFINVIYTFLFRTLTTNKHTKSHSFDIKVASHLNLATPPQIKSKMRKTNNNIIIGLIFLVKLTKCDQFPQNWTVSEIIRSEPYRSNKLPAPFKISPPRDFVETSVADPVVPFQQVYGENCGTINSNSRIVGGQITSIENHPWQVYVHFGGQWMCGGVIISDKWVLTAAHCTLGYGPHSIIVIHGMTKVRIGQVPNIE